MHWHLKRPSIRNILDVFFHSLNLINHNIERFCPGILKLNYWNCDKTQWFYFTYPNFLNKKYFKTFSFKEILTRWYTSKVSIRKVYQFNTFPFYVEIFTIFKFSILLQTMAIPTEGHQFYQIQANEITYLCTNKRGALTSFCQQIIKCLNVSCGDSNLSSSWPSISVCNILAISSSSSGFEAIYQVLKYNRREFFYELKSRMEWNVWASNTKAINHKFIRESEIWQNSELWSDRLMLGLYSMCDISKLSKVRMILVIQLRPSVTNWSSG